MNGWRSRSLLISLLLLAYVWFEALRTRGGHGTAWIGIGVLPLALVLGWMLAAPPRLGTDPIDPAARSAARSAVAGTAVLLACWVGVAGTPVLEAAAVLASASANLAALFVLTRLRTVPGILEPSRAATRLHVFIAASLIWSLAASLPLARLLAPELTTRLDPVSINYAGSSASAAGLLLLVFASARVRRLRRLELGVADRAGASFALSVIVVAIVVPAMILRVATVDRLLALGVASSALTTVFAAISIEPTSVAKTMRVVLGIVLLAAPVLLGGVALSLRYPDASGAILIVAGIIAVFVGLAAPRLARPLGPARSRWLQALTDANDAVLHPDPDSALRSALAAVRAGLPGDSPSPLLFRVDPPDQLSVDRAGFLHADKVQPPAPFFDLADAEPERTVRIEVLRALQVRHAYVRPLLTWMEARGVLSVTSVRDEDGPSGLLALPRGKRRAPMNIEEVRMVRRLADRLSAVLGVSAALERSRSRELGLRELADQRADQIDRLRHQLTAEGGRRQVLTERLAQPLRAKVYSPAATVVLEQVTKFGRLGVPLTLLTPPGVDPVPWAAVGHLAGPRKAKPFVTVYATDAAEQSLERWRDPVQSPLTLAQGGTLLIVDLVVLPRNVQEFLASSLSERISPSERPEPLDVFLAASVPHTVDVLVASDRLSANFADWLGDRSLAVPRLSARSEDLRALVLDHLARVSARVRGEPIGIDDAALALLVEHAWPGNDVELASTTLLAALETKGSRVTRRDLELSGFVQRVTASRRQG